MNDTQLILTALSQEMDHRIEHLSRSLVRHYCLRYTLYAYQQIVLGKTLHGYLYIGLCDGEREKGNAEGLLLDCILSKEIPG